jgi:hypothetical protein
VTTDFATPVVASLLALRIFAVFSCFIILWILHNDSQRQDLVEESAQQQVVSATETVFEEDATENIELEEEEATNTPAGV